MISLAPQNPAVSQNAATTLFIPPPRFPQPGPTTPAVLATTQTDMESLAVVIAPSTTVRVTGITTDPPRLLGAAVEPAVKHPVAHDLGLERDIDTC